MSASTIATKTWHPARTMIILALILGLAAAMTLLGRPPQAQAATHNVSLTVGGDVNRIGKTLIDATNTNFTALNYRKAMASDRIGGTDHLRDLRRYLTGWWYWDAKSVNEISATERTTILRDYWPGDSCTSCLAAAKGGKSAKDLLIENNYVPNAAFIAQRDKEQAAMEEANMAKAKADGVIPQDYVSPRAGGVHALACQGTSKTVPHGVEYDRWYDSCDTDQVIRDYGYGRETCGHIITITTGLSVITFLKNAASTKGVSVAGAVLGAACWGLTTYNVQPIINAKNRSTKAATIMQVRTMNYQGKGSAYVTNTEWVAQ